MIFTIINITIMILNVLVIFIYEFKDTVLLYWFSDKDIIFVPNNKSNYADIKIKYKQLHLYTDRNIFLGCNNRLYYYMDVNENILNIIEYPEEFFYGEQFLNTGMNYQNDFSRILLTRHGKQKMKELKNKKKKSYQLVQNIKSMFLSLGYSLIFTLLTMYNDSFNNWTYYICFTIFFLGNFFLQWSDQKFMEYRINDLYTKYNLIKKQSSIDEERTNKTEI